MLLRKYCVLLLCLMTVVFSIVSCGRAAGNGEITDTGDGEVETFVLTDLEKYTILSGDTSDNIEKDALVLLRQAIMKGLGTTLKATTDWTDENQKEQEKEILIGETNRKESIDSMKGLGNNDYVIKMVGSKLVIVGGSPRATLEAVKFVVDNYIDIYNATLSVPKGKGYKFSYSYLFDSLTINGTDIGEYKLVSLNPEKDISDVSEHISKSIVDRRLEVDDMVRDGRKYIFFDDSHLIASEYGVTLTDEGHLCVYGSYDTFDTAVEYFKTTYFENIAKKSTKYDITFLDDIVLETGRRKIYTKEQLVAVLENVYASPDKIIVGEQCGSQTMPSYTISQFNENNGHEPGIIGVDLSCYGFQLLEMSGTDTSRALCELVSYASRGGIIAVTSRFENPTGNWTSGGKCRGLLGGEESWRELMTEGSLLNETFKKELSIDAIFLKALKDNGVPVLWLPLSESNGNDFWYGAIQGDKTISAEKLKALWVYIYDYFADFGLDNLLWVYNPVASTADDTSVSVLYSYPEEKYTDFVGCSSVVKKGSGVLGGADFSALTSETNKKGALLDIKIDEALISGTKESQSKLYSALNLLDDIKEQKTRGQKFACLLTRSGTSSLGWLGLGNEFFEDESILDINDVAEIFRSVNN